MKSKREITRDNAHKFFFLQHIQKTCGFADDNVNFKINAQNWIQEFLSTTHFHIIIASYPLYCCTPMSIINTTYNLPSLVPSTVFLQACKILLQSTTCYDLLHQRCVTVVIFFKLLHFLWFTLMLYQKNTALIHQLVINVHSTNRLVIYTKWCN